MNQPFTDDDIMAMAGTIQDPSLPYTAGKSSFWQKAFQYYNQQTDIPRKLGMGCRPCYGKVFFYILKKRLQQTNNNHEKIQTTGH